MVMYVVLNQPIQWCGVCCIFYSMSSPSHGLKLWAIAITLISYSLSGTFSFISVKWTVWPRCRSAATITVATSNCRLARSWLRWAHYTAPSLFLHHFFQTPHAPSPSPRPPMQFGISSSPRSTQTPISSEVVCCDRCSDAVFHDIPVGQWWKFAELAQTKLNVQQRVKALTLTPLSTEDTCSLPCQGAMSKLLPHLRSWSKAA